MYVQEDSNWYLHCSMGPPRAVNASGTASSGYRVSKLTVEEEPEPANASAPAARKQCCFVRLDKV